MRLVYLAQRTSIHTVRWVNEMVKRGHEVHLITMHDGGLDLLEPKVFYHKLFFKPPLGYYLNVPLLKSLLWKIKPDILNTHYGSGYGTLARLTGFHPNILSVWGSDVFDFPFESKRNMKIIQKNLQAADQIASTSIVMKKQTEKLWKPGKDILVTPFGVDCNKFSPRAKKNSKLRIGTVKDLLPQYGISYLIEAFALAKRHGLQNTDLYIVGGGAQEEELKQLTVNLGIQSEVTFVGSVPFNDVPNWLNSFDIYVALSITESFGVAIIEASACGLPVLVSDASGLTEVVKNNITGFIIPKKNEQVAADRLLLLANDPDLRRQLGRNGRELVLEKYNWVKNADLMEKLYEEVLRDYRTSKVN